MPIGCGPLQTSEETRHYLAMALRREDKAIRTIDHVHGPQQGVIRVILSG
jgi:hypothetical protein